MTDNKGPTSTYWWEYPENLAALGYHLSLDGESPETWTLAEYAKALHKPWEMQEQWEEYQESLPKEQREQS